MNAPARPLAYQTDFIELCMALGVLKFGAFRLKSGRESPYFFNAGLFNTGAAIAAVGRAYAAAAASSGLPFDMLFGPAYKGIPLVTATAAALAEVEDRNVPFAFNRKEAKDHGEGGSIVGSPLTGKVLIVDDVITAGTAIRESIDIIRGAGATPAGVLLALDRQERGAIAPIPRSRKCEISTVFRSSPSSVWRSSCGTSRPGAGTRTFPPCRPIGSVMVLRIEE